MFEGNDWDLLSLVSSDDSCDGMINSLAFDPSNRFLYVGGTFSACGQINTPNIAKYSRANGWSSLSPSLTFQPESNPLGFAFGASGLVYIAGQFVVRNQTQIIAENVVAYNPVTDSYIPMGVVTGKVDSILVLPNSDNIIIGGRFSFMDGIGNSYFGLAFWRGNGWEPLAHVNGQPSRMILNGSTLIVAGQFSRIQGG